MTGWQGDRVTGWQDDRMTWQPDDWMTRWLNDQWLDDWMTGWQNEIIDGYFFKVPLINCLQSRPLDPNFVCLYISCTCWKKFMTWWQDEWWQDDRMTWQHMTRWPDDRMTGWPYDRMTNDSMTGWKADRMTGGFSDNWPNDIFLSAKHTCKFYSCLLISHQPVAFVKRMMIMINDDLMWQCDDMMTCNFADSWPYGIFII